MQFTNDIFDPQTDTFEVTGLDNLATLCKYPDHKKGRFIYGFILDEDLLTEQGVTLYTKNTQITPHEIKRLYLLQENNPFLSLNFKLKRSDRLLKSFRREIVGKLELLVELRLNYKVYKSLLSSIADDVRAFVDEILSEEDIVLAIYRMKYLAENMPGKEGARFFNHSVSTALFTFAIARSDDLKKKVNFTQEDLKELTKSALFYNFGAIIKIMEILQKDDPGEREAEYNKANYGTLELIKSVNMQKDCKIALLHSVNYYRGEQEFVRDAERKSSWMANIIILADQYLRFETGLFGTKYKPSQIIDMLIIKSVERKLNRTAIKALAVALNMDLIMQFYAYIEKLKKLCVFKGGGHSAPYPLTGFRSPSTFICKDHISDCPYYKGVGQAVNIKSDLPGLEKGSYAMCSLITGKLIEYYKKHFKKNNSN